MDLEKVLNKRRSIRHYTDKKVSYEILKDLIRSASLSPVSCNLQLTQYVIVDDEELLLKLSKEVSYKFKYSPCSIIVLHDSRFSIERSSGIMTAGMAVENILLKATELGLGTCAMAGFNNDQKIKEILKIPEYMEVLLMISVGYPDLSFDMNSMPRIGVRDRFNFNVYGELRTLNDSPDLSKQSVEDIINYRKRISPVYLDRFRLNTYSESYYYDIFNYLDEFIFKNRTGKVLDLMSYDGWFLKIFYERGLANRLSIVSSDYLKNNLDFFNKKFGFEGLIVDKENNINSQDKFDFITYIFQVSFTPNQDILIKNIKNLLKKDGLMVVSCVHESYLKKVARLTQYLYKKLILRKTFNIYENNPFYKIGPIIQYSPNSIVKIFDKNGFVLKNMILRKKSRGNKLGIYIFKLKN